MFLAQRCFSVVSIEDDANWRTEVTQQLQREGLMNVQVQYCPFDFRDPVNFGESGYLQALNGDPFDAIVIDGQDWTFSERPLCFERAESLIRPGGIIIVDDSWRYTELRESAKALRYEVYESVGPCRYGVTSTDVFFY